MYIKTTILFITLFVLAATANAQKITGVEYSLFEKYTNDYWLRISPKSFDGTVAETTKTSGVYAVMICYTYNGNQKSVFQDVTSKFVKGEDYTYTFSYGTSSLDKLRVNNITFFRRDKDKSTWPSKEGCNEGTALSGANSYGVSTLYNQ